MFEPFVTLIQHTGLDMTGQLIPNGRTFSSGPMPNTNARTYEELEHLLSRLYRTFLALQSSLYDDDKASYGMIASALAGLAKRAGIQAPEDAVRTPRSSWPMEITPCEAFEDVLATLWHDFVVKSGNDNRQDFFRLARAVCQVLRRHQVFDFVVVRYPDGLLYGEYTARDDEKLRLSLKLAIIAS